MPDDRYDVSDSDFAKRRRESRVKRKEAAFEEEHKDRLDKIRRGEPVPLPPPPDEVPGPPPKDFEAVPTPTDDQRAEVARRAMAYKKNEFNHADVLDGLTVLVNGCAVLEDCIGIRVSESGKGLLVSSPNLTKADWFPVSGIHDDSDVFKVGTEGRLILEAWAAKKRGWE